MSTARVEPWGRLMARPACELRVACPLPAAMATLTTVGREARLRVKVSPDGRTVEVRDKMAVALNLLQLVTEPTEFFTSSVLAVTAGEEGPASTLLSLTVRKRDASSLRTAAAGMLSRYVHVLEHNGVGVQVGPWRDLALAGRQG
ncbi:hypothetical protein [Actinotalea subterranea]|uniref:hypothetical protein n=1 Tax=Actinotalea subterranea TaxID=2607497 RepID=UPI0011EE909B|nr:hypothetical protein [Actinotalea subterranea]